MMMSHLPYDASHFQYLFFFTESLHQATGLMTTPCLQRSDGRASSYKPLEMKIKDLSSSYNRTRLAVDVMMPMRLSAGAAALGHIPHHVCNLGWNLFALSSLFV
ncbi:unnamed protein product [Sphagnum balticum]